MLSGALPLTPGGGIESPAARMLLSAMRPGWALDPAAGVSTPYVEQLLRTLPVLTPDTGTLSAWRPMPCLSLARHKTALALASWSRGTSAAKRTRRSREIMGRCANIVRSMSDSIMQELQCPPSFCLVPHIFSIPHV